MATLDLHTKWIPERSYSLYLNYKEMEDLRRLLKDVKEEVGFCSLPLVARSILNQLDASDEEIRSERAN